MRSLRGGRYAGPYSQQNKTVRSGAHHRNPPPHRHFAREAPLSPPPLACGLRSLVGSGTKGPLRSRFAATAFWPAHGVSSRGPLPTTPVQLLIEWPKPAAAPITSWLASLGDEALGLRRFVRLAKGRWRIEQDDRKRQDELGLDLFEGRTWPGWHHHITLASMAYAVSSRLLVDATTTPVVFGLIQSRCGSPTSRR